MAKERLIWADSLKGWLMILVILGHVMQQLAGGVDGGSHLWAMIYSFHMPAFIAASGWFSYKRNRTGGGYKSAIKRRFMQLMVPYLLWSVIKLVRSWDFSYNTIADVFFRPDTSFWFLWVLFWINVIFIGCQSLADILKMEEMFTIGFMAILLVGLMAGANIRLFGFQFLAYYFVFYVLGYCLHRFEWMRVSNKWVICFMMVIWLYLAWYWQMAHVPTNIAGIPHLPSSLAIQGYRFVTAMLAVVIIQSTSPKCLNSKNWINLKAVEMGGISLGVYAVHLLLLDDIIAFLNVVWVDIPNCLLIVSTFVVLTIVSFGIVKLLSLNRVTSKFLLGKV